MDPKLIRDPATWQVVSLLCADVVRAAAAAAGRHSAAVAAAASLGRGGGGGGAASGAEAAAGALSKELVRCAGAACRVAHEVVAGARANGLEEIEHEHHAGLVGGPASLHASAAALAGSDLVARDHEALATAAAELCGCLKPGVVVVTGLAGSEAGSDAGGLGGLGEDDDDAAADGEEHNALLEAATHAEHDFGASGPRPSEELKYFREALINNPHLRKTLLASRFHLVEVLEDAEAETAADSRVEGAHALGAAVITWSGIVRRFVRFLDTHNYDLDQEADCLRIFRCLHLHLVRARCEKDGTLHEFPELDARRRRAYAAKQASLVGLGAVRSVLEAVAHHPANHEGNLADKVLPPLPHDPPPPPPPCNPPPSAHTPHPPHPPPRLLVPRAYFG